MLKLKKVIFSNGERYSFLEGKDGMPHFYSTLWNTVKLRPDNIQVSTIDNHLDHVNWLLHWEHHENRSLYEEFQQGHFLTSQDVDKIKRHMSLDISYQKRKAKFKKKVVSLSEMPQLVDSDVTVSKYTQYNRLTSVAMYLTFLAEVATQRINTAEIVKAIESMEKALKRARPKGRKGNTTYSRVAQGIPQEILAEFIEISRYDSDKNPFKNAGVRLRNDLLIRLIDETGCRPGELLSAQINTMSLTGSGKKHIHIRRTHDDVLDTRINQPVTKTKERQIVIKDTTAKLIHQYIVDFRKKIIGSGKHPYLFISHQGKTKGAPLSESAFKNTVMPTFKAVNEEFTLIYPYFFRHNYNDKLSDKVDKNNELADKGVEGYKHISPEKEEKMRMHLMGHSDPKSAAPYIQRHVTKEADRMQLLEQEKMKQTLKQGLDVIEREKKA